MNRLGVNQAGLGFNRGGGGSAPDIERTGLLFNIDIQDLSTLFYSPALDTYEPAQIDKTVNKIIAKTSTGDIELLSGTLANAMVLKRDANGKYYLDCSGSSFTYTKDRVATASAATLFTTLNKCVVNTAKIASGTTCAIVKGGPLGNCFMGCFSGDNRYLVGNTANGDGVPYTGSSACVFTVIPKGTKSTTTHTSIGAINVTSIDTVNSGKLYEWPFNKIDSPASTICFYGLQVYDGTLFDAAKILDINTKAISYYGVAI